MNGYGHFPQSAEFHSDPARLFLSNGNGSFTESASALGTAVTDDNRGVVAFDYDRDGDVDLFFTNNYGAPKLLRNDAGGSSLTVKFRGAELAAPEALARVGPAALLPRAARAPLGALLAALAMPCTLSAKTDAVNRPGPRRGDPGLRSGAVVGVGALAVEAAVEAFELELALDPADPVAAAVRRRLAACEGGAPQPRTLREL